VRWISSALPRNEEREVIVTVAEGGGMFVIDQETGRFLWSRPFPFDDPNINMNDIDVKTGETRVNVDKLFKRTATRSWAAITIHAALVDRLSPWKELGLRPVPGPMPVHDGEYQEQVRLGPRAGVPRPGIDPRSS